MKIFFADTNLFLRFFLHDVPAQALLVREYLEKAKTRKLKLIILPIIVFEIVFALQSVYKFNRSKIANHVKTIVSMDYLEVEDREIFLEILDLYEKTNVDFVDLFLFCKAKGKKGEVLSFDKDFKKLKMKQ